MQSRVPSHTIHYGAKRDLEAWFHACVYAHSTERVVIISGRPGIGKTHLVNQICARFNNVARVVDVTMFEATQDLLTALQVVMGQKRDLQGRDFAVIFEGVDAFTEEIYTAIVNKVLPRLLVPTIFICNDPYGRWCRPLTQRYLHVRMYPPSVSDLYAISVNVHAAAAATKVKKRRRGGDGPTLLPRMLDHEDYEAVAQASMGDIRQCIYLSSNLLTRGKVQARGTCVTNPFDMARIMLQNTTSLRDRWSILEDQFDTRSLVLPLLVETVMTSPTPLDCDFADMVSLGDSFPSAEWEGVPPYGFLLSCGACALLPPSLSSPEITFPAKLFDRDTERRNRAIMDAMRSSLPGMRLSRSRGIIDLYQFFANPDLTPALSNDSVHAAVFNEAMRAYAINTVIDRTTRDVLLRDVNTRRGTKRAAAPTFRAPDHEEVAALATHSYLKGADRPPSGSLPPLKPRTTELKLGGPGVAGVERGSKGGHPL